MEVNYLWWHNCKVTLQFELKSMVETENLRDALLGLGYKEQGRDLDKLIDFQISGEVCKNEISKRGEE